MHAFAHPPVEKLDDRDPRLRREVAVTCAVGRARLLRVLRWRHGVELHEPAEDVARLLLGLVAIPEERLVLDDDERVRLRVHGDGRHLHRAAGVATPFDRSSLSRRVRLDPGAVVQDGDESICCTFTADRVDRGALRIVEAARIVGVDIAHDAAAVPRVDLLATHRAVSQGREQGLDRARDRAHDARAVIGESLAGRVHHRRNGEDACDRVRVLVTRTLDEDRCRPLPTSECVLVALVTRNLHLREHQLLYAVGGIERETDVGLQARHHAAEWRSAIDPVRALGKRLRNESTERITPHVNALRSADLLGEERVDLLTGAHSVLDSPAIARVGGTRQRVPTLQERLTQ